MDNKTAIIFIHGFMGCSSQFDGLIRILDTKSVSCHKLFLPGHETTLSEFNKSRSKHWHQYDFRFPRDELKKIAELICEYL